MCNDTESISIMWMPYVIHAIPGPLRWANRVLSLTQKRNHIWKPYLAAYLLINYTAQHRPWKPCFRFVISKTVFSSIFVFLICVLLILDWEKVKNKCKMASEARESRAPPRSAPSATYLSHRLVPMVPYPLLQTCLLHLRQGHRLLYCHWYHNHTGWQLLPAPML